MENVSGRVRPTGSSNEAAAPNAPSSSSACPTLLSVTGDVISAQTEWRPFELPADLEDKERVSSPTKKVRATDHGVAQ